MKSFSNFINEVSDAGIKARKKRLEKSYASLETNDNANKHHKEAKKHYRLWDNHYVETGKDHADHRNNFKDSFEKHKEIVKSMDKKDKNYNLHFSNHKDLIGDHKRVFFMHNFKSKSKFDCIP
jgi:hypothetical protein